MFYPIVMLVGWLVHSLYRAALFFISMICIIYIATGAHVINYLVNDYRKAKALLKQYMQHDDIQVGWGVVQDAYTATFPKREKSDIPVRRKSKSSKTKWTFPKFPDMKPVAMGILMIVCGVIMGAYSTMSTSPLAPPVPIEQSVVATITLADYLAVYDATKDQERAILELKSLSHEHIAMVSTMQSKLSSKEGEISTLNDKVVKLEHQAVLDRNYVKYIINKYRK